MKTYSTATSARRALKNELAKNGLALDEVGHEIVKTEGGQFAYRSWLLESDLDTDQQAMDDATASCDQAAAEAILEAPVVPVARRGRPSSLAGKRFTAIVTSNVRRPGSLGHATLALVLANPGATYEELLALGATAGQLRHDEALQRIKAE